MPGRHDVPLSGRRRWAPTTLDALVAVTPATSLAAAFGLAGGGYLAGREGVAACGALASAFGLAVERIQTRGVRVRLRRERVRHRDDVMEVSRLLDEVRQAVAGLRADLDDVRTERDEVRAELQGVLGELAGARRGVAAGPGLPLRAGTAAIAPNPSAIAVEAVGREPVEQPSEAPTQGMPARPLSLLLPGQVRSPIATGGIPVLAPGPREPVRSIDRRSVRPGADDETQPLPAMTAERADALVYAAMAASEAAELTSVLAGPGPADRCGGRLHTGDAHHAGDYTPEMTDRSGTTLYIVRRGKHVA